MSRNEFEWYFVVELILFLFCLYNEYTNKQFSSLKYINPYYLIILKRFTL